MTESPEKYPFLRGLVRSLVTVGGIIGICFGLAGLASRQTEAEPTAPARVFALPEVVLSQPSPEARAMAALAKNKPEDARRALKAELNRATEPSLGRLRYLLAKATPDIVEARPLLEALAASAHPLANWGRLRLTERLRETDPNAAAESAALLMSAPLFRARAEQLMALSLYAAGRPEETEPLLRSLVAEAPERSAAVSVAMPLATILAAKADLESRKYAIAVYRRVITRAPLSDSAEQARIAVQALLAHMPEAQRTALSSLTADEAFAEAEALQNGRDYMRAAERFAAIAQRFKGDPKSVCDARLGQGKALFSANKRNEALTVFEDVARLCPSAEHRASAHFQAGRVLLRRGDPRGAIAHYDAVAREFPSHRLADDALFAAATAFHDLNDTA
jgi:TolA-binding protein